MIGTATKAIKPAVAAETRRRAAAPVRVRRDPFLRASLAVGVVAVAWIGLTFVFDEIRFAALSPELQVAIEAAASFARIFGALMLHLFAERREETRLRWMALALTLLGVSGLVFGYVLPATSGPLSYNTSIMLSAYIWALAAAFIVLGYLPARPPSLASRRTRGLLGVGLLAIPALAWGAGDLPPLVNVASFEQAARTDLTILRGLTAWHWAISSVPLAVALAGLVGVYRRRNDEALGGWLLLAMMLWVSSQLHNLFWPSGYIPILTTAGVLRLLFAGVVAVSGVIGLREAADAFRQLAEDRAMLLAAERESAQRLAHLALLRGDFTSMVAHELGNPVAAIRRQTELLAVRAGDDPVPAAAYASILAETDLLGTLIRDVQDIAAMERTDFRVQVTAIPIGVLIADAAAFGETLPGGHPVSASAMSVRVRADPDRIGQVLRNLVINAATYSAPGSPIAISAAKQGQTVRVSVTDHGPGIPPAEQTLIFEKFSRGRAGKEHARGTGLGLYVAKRIVEAHDSALTVQSTVGQGATFAFELAVAS